MSERGYELTGTVKLVMDRQTYDSGFTKREFVVTTQDDKYPQDIKLECVKDKIAQLEGINPGDTVTVAFDLRGNEYNGRYFVNLSAWRVIRSGGESQPQDTSEPPDFGALAGDAKSEPVADDNLPF